jgi:dynein heavy chain
VHRDEIFKLIEADIPMNDTNTGYAPFSVRMLLQYSVLDTFDQIQSISGMASKEYRCVCVRLCVCVCVFVLWRA